MKTLIVGNFLSSHSGSRSVCEDLSIQLEANGWFIIRTSNKKNRILKLLDMVYTASFYKGNYKAAQIDVFSGYAFFWAEIVGLLLNLMKKPFILTLHGGNLPLFSQCWPKRVKRFLHSAAFVTTPSDYLFEKMKYYCKNLVLIPNPIDINNYKFRHRKFLMPKIVWLRAFHSIYNPSLAVKVIANLIGEFPNIDLTMYGPNKCDDSYNEFINLSKSLSVSHCVHAPGKVKKSDVSEYLSSYDIFLNTTNIDNTPVSIIEAMACGLCIVSTNVGGIPYLLEHEKNALLVPPNDPQRMANAVRRLLTEPDLAEHLSKNARAKALNFDWSLVLPMWENLLSKITNNKKN